MSLLSLDAAATRKHHVLAVPARVSPQEFEILVRSRFIDVWRQDEYTLAVSADTSFSGRYEIEAVARAEMGLPGWANGAFVAHVPPCRGDALPGFLAGIDPVMDAYTDGVPDGSEMAAIQFFMACARRLGGAVALAGGAVVVPNPALAPHLTLYSPIWLDPDALVTRIEPVLGPLRTSLQDADRHNLPDEVMTRYGAYTTAPGDFIEIRVEDDEMLPASVAAFDWAQGGAVSYQLRYFPKAEVDYSRDVLDERQLAATDEAAHAIAKACRALQEVAPGAVADDDGFLVDLATTEAA